MTVHRDRAMVADRSPQATYAPEQLGRTQALTPEGYLLCSGVRVARTGAMLYLPAEVPEVRPAPNGQMIVVTRDADVLFDPEALASFNGKPVTDDHPPALVGKDDAKKYQVGVTLNPRRGEGVDSEYLVADLLITDAPMIAKILAKKKREISLGYDAEVEEVKPGLGRQARIIGNHTAIVDRGRAGSTCAITDKETDMAKRNMSLMDRVRAAFRDNDETALESALADASEVLGTGEPDGDEGGVHVHIHNGTREEPAPAATTTDEADPNEARFKALEDSVGGIMARLDEMAAAKTEPAAPVVETIDEDPEEEAEAERSEVMDAQAKAEIIFPGFKPGTMDGTPKRRALTELRRDVLSRAFNDSARRTAVEPILTGVDLAKSKPAQVRVLFDAAAAVAKMHNTRPRAVTAIPQGPMTAAKLQEQIAARRQAKR